jgi:acetolactate synthase I/II/III large subunit
VVCVFNDQGYGVLRWLQDTRFGRINETDIGKMDFAMLARSLGVPGERVKSPAEFAAAVDRAMAATGPYLIDVDMEHFKPMEISVMPKKKAGAV